METSGMLGWAYQYALEHLFEGDKRRMALDLRMTEKTLDAAMMEESSAQSMLLFELLFGYMNARGISMDDLLARYLREKE